jgi:hypothetical protein
MGRVAQTPLAAVGLLTLLLAALPRPHIGLIGPVDSGAQSD